MKVLIGPLVCQGCRGTVVYGDAQIAHRGRPPSVKEQLIWRRGFYELGGERHRCPHVEKAAAA